MLKLTYAYIQTHDTGDAHFILAATSSNEKNISISLWRKQVLSKGQNGKMKQLTVISILESALQRFLNIIAIAAIAVLVLQIMVRDPVKSQ